MVAERSRTSGTRWKLRFPYLSKARLVRAALRASFPALAAATSALVRRCRVKGAGGSFKAAILKRGYTEVLHQYAVDKNAHPRQAQDLREVLDPQEGAVGVRATFWSALWGPIGLVLATPLTVCLVVLGRHVERLQFLDVMFGDRPALSPPEIFYQRMLVGDPTEASDKAEEFKERSLAAYFDEVALMGLAAGAGGCEPRRFERRATDQHSQRGERVR